MSNNFQKVNIFNVVDYAVVDYDSASDIIIENAKKNNSFGVSALAVHGLITAVKHDDMQKAVQKIDMVVPDGQPVRWAMNSYYKVGLKDRVYGPELTLHVLKKANIHNLKIYLYGSTKETIDKFVAFINEKYKNVIICGVHVDRFREATEEEDLEDIKKINALKPHIVLVGRGCPRQEKWVANHLGKIDAAMMAVGAAFNFHAGNLKQAPKWMQKNGLEWLFRLIQEPRRLFKRYFTTNTHFIYLFFKFKFFKKRKKI